jgi:hypothetical protein
LIDRLTEYFSKQTIQEKGLKRQESQETVVEDGLGLGVESKSSDNFETADKNAMENVEPVAPKESEALGKDHESEQEVQQVEVDAQQVEVVSKSVVEEEQDQLKEERLSKAQEQIPKAQEPREPTQKTGIPQVKRPVQTEPYSVKKPKRDLYKKKKIATPIRKGIIESKSKQPPCPLPADCPVKEFTFCPPSNAPELPKKFNLEESLKRPLKYTPYTGILD